MNSPDSGLYARSFGDIYDTWYGNLDDPSELVGSFQERLPLKGKIVEFGGGTGRLSIPLVAAGFEVISLDVSHAMLHVAADKVTSVAGDIVAVPVRSQSVDAVLVAYNTLFNLNRPSLQNECLREAARLLVPGGLLALECFVAPAHGPANFGISMRDHPTNNEARLAILSGPSTALDEATIVGSHIELVGNRAICRPWTLAYQSPSDLDAAAESAGLVLTHRSSDWSNAPFDADSDRHVSWYIRAA